MGSSKKQTVGYKYSLGMHQILCHGPVDSMSRYTVDDRVAWSGVSAGGPITVNAPSLFGGEAREGGISGVMDLEMGGPDQVANAYLQSQLGFDIPAFQGVVGIVMNQMYLGNNPYLKKNSFRLTRVLTRQDGLEQWYPEKAPVPNGNGQGLGEIIGPTSSGWKYLITSNSDPSDYSAEDFDDSEWDTGSSPFASSDSQPYAEEAGFPLEAGTTWPINTSIWIRRTFVFDSAAPVTLQAFIDNWTTVWVNGVLVQPRIGSTGSPGVDNFLHDIEIPAGVLRPGQNVFVMKGEDYGSYAYAAFKITAGSLPAHDMNPAHIIRECLTDPIWGMGYNEEDIYDLSFILAADTLYDENMGMSLLWDRQMPIEQFVQEVVKHINAALYVGRRGPEAGKFVLKLIRNDYDPDALPLFDESNVEKMEGFKRVEIGELTNSVTVNYVDSETGKPASTTAQDPALVQQQGAVINTTMQYPGFTYRSLADRGGGGR